MNFFVRYTVYFYKIKEILTVQPEKILLSISTEFAHSQCQTAKEEGHPNNTSSKDASLHSEPVYERDRRLPLTGDGHLPHRRLRDEPIHRGGASAGDNPSPLDRAS